MRGVCITTYNGILDMRVVITRPTIDKLILMDPPACACSFNVFDSIHIRDAIIYVSAGFPEMLNHPDIWTNRIPRGGHREEYPGGPRELGFVRGSLPNPPRYEDIGFVPFIPPPPPQPAQPQAPIPPPPEYEYVSDNEAEAVVYEVMNDAGVNEANAVVEAVVVISDAETEGVNDMILEEDDDDDDVHYVGYEVEDEEDEAGAEEEEEEEEKKEEDVNYDAEDEADDDDDDVVNELSDCVEPYEYDDDNDDDVME